MPLTLRHEFDPATGIAALWVNQPEKPVVVLDSWLLQQIDLFLDQIDPRTRGNHPEVRGFALFSASERVFIAGADLGEINALDDAGLDKYLAFGQGVFNRIEALPFPTVACINGDVLGGGLEICLACQYRIAAQPVKRPYQIGLPEAKLGLLPGWGGTQRLGALIDAGHALGRTATGRTFTAATALRYGLVDAVVPRDHLQQSAVDIITVNPKAQRARTIQQRKAALERALTKGRVLATRPVRKLPAAQKVAEAVHIGLTHGLQAGLDAERKFLIDLKKTPESEGLMGAFFARGGAVRQLTKGIKDAPLPTEQIAIMGQSETAEYLAKGLGGKARVMRITAETEETGAQVFIEAVGGGQEKRHDQMAALRRLSAIAPDDALIITTSPVLALSEVAGSVTHPQRLLGLAPTLPLRKTQAIEFIKHPQTSPAAIAAGANLVKILGLVPIPQVGGGPTLVVRLFGEIGLRAIELARQSGDPAGVDRLARNDGFAAGPLRTLDRIGVARCAAAVGREVLWTGIPSIFAAPDRPEPSSAFRASCAGPASPLSAGEAQFATTALVEAGRRALSDGIAENPETIWQACIFALGLGAWRKAEVLAGLKG